MKELPVVVYRPGSALRNPLRLIRDMLKDVSAGRGLAWQLAVRDIKAQYRQAFLGIFWVLILPLANTVVWLFLHRAGIISVNAIDVPYPLYVFCGTMLWAVLMDAVNAPLAQTTAAKSMLSRVSFPREALIVSGILQTLFNAVIKVALLIVVVLLSGVSATWGLLLFPLGVLVLIGVGTTIGLLMTPLGLLYTDVGKGLALLMQFLMFVTPVVYPVPDEGWAKTLILSNPLTPLIETTRDWLTGSPADMVGGFVVVTMIFVVLGVFAAIMCRLALPILIERMGA